MMAPADIVKKVEAALPGAEVSVKDLTGTLDHFRVTVIALQFEGMEMIEQHRMMYAIMSDSMEAQGGGIHALSLSTYTPDQLSKK